MKDWLSTDIIWIADGARRSFSHLYRSANRLSTVLSSTFSTFRTQHFHLIFLGEFICMLLTWHLSPTRALQKQNRCILCRYRHELLHAWSDTSHFLYAYTIFSPSLYLRDNNEMLEDLICVHGNVNISRYIYSYMNIYACMHAENKCLYKRMWIKKI